MLFLIIRYDLEPLNFKITSTNRLHLDALVNGIDTRVQLMFLFKQNDPPRNEGKTQDAIQLAPQEMDLHLRPSKY